MKKIIALVLVLCMSFGMIVSVSAASPFIQRLNLARLIRSMFASDENDYGFGEVKDGILTVYVAKNGKKDADGTEKNPYATIEAARDANIAYEPQRMTAEQKENLLKAYHPDYKTEEFEELNVSYIEAVSHYDEKMLIRH